MSAKTTTTAQRFHGFQSYVGCCRLIVSQWDTTIMAASNYPVHFYFPLYHSMSKRSQFDFLHILKKDKSSKLIVNVQGVQRNRCEFTLLQPFDLDPSVHFRLHGAAYKVSLSCDHHLIGFLRMKCADLSRILMSPSYQIECGTKIHNKWNDGVTCGESPVGHKCYAQQLTKISFAYFCT